MTDPLADVSCETRDKLDAFVALLGRWNTRINLIAPGDIDIVWDRHIRDSAQVFAAAPATARTWVDLGSGGGFPGLVCAILAGKTCAVTLIEADTRKAAFLREAVRTLDLTSQIISRRIETLDPQPYDVVSARALAPLRRLLDLAERFRSDSTCLLFPKGRMLESELTQAQDAWHIEAERIPSHTDPDAAILRITDFRRRA